jgi:hypothetical protein
MSLRFDEQIKTARLLKAETLLAMTVASEVIAEQEGKDCIITSITRLGTFEENGYHAAGYAFDFRTVSLSNPGKVVAALQARLGFLGYDVLLEGAPPHGHVEYDLIKAQKREATH